MRRRPQGELEPLEEAKGEGHERGDTLVEVLLALVVLGLAGMALLLGFATSITSSAEHRHLATLDASVRAASDEVIAQVQDATDNAFGPTACSSPYHPTWTLSGSVHVTSYSVWYWNGSNFASGNACTNYGPQQWTMNLSDGSYTTSVTTVIYDPQAPTVTGGTTPAKLVFVLPSTQNPGTGTINAPVSPPPLVAVEDAANNIVYGDVSAVSLSVTSGPGTLSSNCVGLENTGLFSFSGCSFDRGRDLHDHSHGLEPHRDHGHRHLHDHLGTSCQARDHHHCGHRHGLEQPDPRPDHHSGTGRLR